MRVIRELNRDEGERLVEWAAQEGWNPGLHDGTLFHGTDPAGFLGAFVDDEMVAGVSAIAYGPAYGFVGLYICRPDRRGEGHGKAVWEAGMARLGRRTIGLDAVPAREQSYAGMGFAAAYRTHRLSGRVSAQSHIDSVRPITPSMTAEVAACDRMIFPTTRNAFLEQWVVSPHIGMALMAGDRIAGYGVARECREGWKIGPLCAGSVDEAMALLGALSLASGGEILHLDVPEPRRAFGEKLLAAGFTSGFETTRMYKGVPPHEAAPAQLFAVTTLELG